MKKVRVEDAVGMALCHDVTAMFDGFKGALFRPVRFCPTFSKHAGKVCEGVDILLTDPRRFDAFRFALFVHDIIKIQGAFTN